MPDEQRAWMEAVLSRLQLEELKLISELVDALLYDQNHPGESTAVLIQEKIRRYIPSKKLAEE